MLWFGSAPAFLCWSMELLQDGQRLLLISCWNLLTNSSPAGTSSLFNMLLEPPHSLMSCWDPPSNCSPAGTSSLADLLLEPCYYLICCWNLLTNSSACLLSTSLNILNWTAAERPTSQWRLQLCLSMYTHVGVLFLSLCECECVCVRVCVRARSFKLCDGLSFSSRRLHSFSQYAEFTPIQPNMTPLL